MTFYLLYFENWFLNNIFGSDQWGKTSGHKGIDFMWVWNVIWCMSIQCVWMDCRYVLHVNAGGSTTPDKDSFCSSDLPGFSLKPNVVRHEFRQWRLKNYRAIAVTWCASYMINVHFKFQTNFCFYSLVCHKGVSSLPIRSWYFLLLFWYTLKNF